MLKKLLLLAILFLSFQSFSQIPSGYYNSATGSGYTLKTQLKSIIKNGHIDKGYGALYNAYIKTDNDAFYENDNTVLDMYSEKPSSSDPYNYNHNTRKCGNYNSENDCYNREHIFPQGFFNSKYPMRSDIHHVVPSDGYVNGKRSNFPFGEVNSATWTSSNGSKLGSNTTEGYTNTVFEPLDEFKGDIARMLFYFATRYEDDVTSSTWDAHTVANNPLNGTNNQVYEDWYIKLLYKWHTDDPVNQREITRNNEAYIFQGNRNPFIDHPEYVNNIWGSVLSVKSFSFNKKNISVYPNPSSIRRITITFSTKETIDNVSLYSILGKIVYHQKKPKLTNSKLKIKNLKPGIYLLKVTSDFKNVTKKVIIK